MTYYCLDGCEKDRGTLVHEHRHSGGRCGAVTLNANSINVKNSMDNDISIKIRLKTYCFAY